MILFMVYNGSFLLSLFGKCDVFLGWFNLIALILSFIYTYGIGALLFLTQQMFQCLHGFVNDLYM